MAYRTAAVNVALITTLNNETICDNDPMISKDELREQAKGYQLDDADVQRDYALFI